MSRAKTNKLYRTFVKGLISEAGYLTFPEDSSYDESNTILSRKGNRTRRPGIDFENDYQLHALVSDNTDATVEYVWKAVNESADTNFLCLQIGQYIRFFSLEDGAISDSFKAFYIDLNSYIAPGYSVDDIRLNHCEFSSGKGYLFIAHQYCEPLIVEYDNVLDSITIGSISILIRDFDGLDDGLPNDEEPLDLTKEHHYNLQNQGWVGPESNEIKVNDDTTQPGGYVYNTEIGSYTGPYTRYWDEP